MVIRLFIFLLCQIGAGGNLTQLRFDRVAVDKLHIRAPAHFDGIGQHRPVIAYDINGIHGLDLLRSPLLGQLLLFFLLRLLLLFLLFHHFLRMPCKQHSRKCSSKQAFQVVVADSFFQYHCSSVFLSFSKRSFAEEAIM
ncbi:MULTISPECIES: hypothetical protein [Sphingobacterium]|nr:MULTISPECIES: hypothetical protein [Sphingobacterium]